MALRGTKEPPKPKKHRWRRTAARETVLATPMEERDRIEQLTGYTMGDSYRGVWDCLIETTQLRRNAMQGLKSVKDPKKREALEKRVEELRKEIGNRMLDILPYERPRQIKSDGTQTHTFVKPDLSGLTDEELDAFERIALKLGAAASAGAVGPARLPALVSRGKAAPPRATTDRHRDARLRKAPKGAS